LFKPVPQPGFYLSNHSEHDHYVRESHPLVICDAAMSRDEAYDPSEVKNRTSLFHTLIHPVKLRRKPMHKSIHAIKVYSRFAGGYAGLRTVLRTGCRALPIVVLLSACALAQTVTTIHDFGSGHDGQGPQSGVIFDRNGNIFGTAALGGQSGGGAVYSLSLSDSGEWSETVLHQFAGRPDGDTPDSLLTMTADGRLFGTTQLGGAKNLGSVFTLAPPPVSGGAWREQVLYSFGTTPNDGTGPNMGLTKVKSALFGVTVDGGANRRGTIFQLRPSSDSSGQWTETILYSFAASPDGGFPSSDLVMDSKGNFYGTTLLGGAKNVGAVYRLSPPATQGAPWTETVIYSFSGPDGSSPFGHLVFDKAGVLYGTTSGGGTRQEGTVYTLTPQAGDTWVQETLYNFSGGRDGGNPEAGITIGQSGSLFGTASTGGSGGPDFGGVIFRLDPPANDGDPWTETVLKSFGGPDGFRSLCRLVPRNGKMYGTTSLGGLHGSGTVFEMTP
jgi:uncharacterized repeat protein (TIGR03803 family)